MTRHLVAILSIALAAALTLPACAQKKKVLPDKKIVGTWVQVSMQYEGEREIVARCKANAKASPEIQRMIRQYILNGSK